jgi:hypothetical protein
VDAKRDSEQQPNSDFSSFQLPREFAEIDADGKREIIEAELMLELGYLPHDSDPQVRTLKYIKVTREQHRVLMLQIQAGLQPPQPAIALGNLARTHKQLSSADELPNYPANIENQIDRNQQRQGNDRVARAAGFASFQALSEDQRQVIRGQVNRGLCSKTRCKNKVYVDKRYTDTPQLCLDHLIQYNEELVCVDCGSNEIGPLGRDWDEGPVEFPYDPAAGRAAFGTGTFTKHNIFPACGKCQGHMHQRSTIKKRPRRESGATAAASSSSSSGRKPPPPPSSGAGQQRTTRPRIMTFADLFSC